MKYQGIRLEDLFHIDELYSIHYFEYMSSFFYPGESHDFWEFIFVDKGQVTIGADEHTHILRRGQIAFHKPGEFHWVKAGGGIAPNLIVVSFSCSGSAIHFFRDRILEVEEPQRRLLAALVREAGVFLDGRLDDPYQTTLHVRSDAPAGSGQLIRLSLEQLLISLYRREENKHAAPHLQTTGHLPAPDKTTKENMDEEVFARIVQYLNENISKRITIEKICRDNLIGRSQLQKLFQKKSSCGIIEYFSRLKIDTARQMIRSERMNFTQISAELGYSSIHYFSRQFKQITGMTPTEYASSVKAMAGR